MSTRRDFLQFSAGAAAGLLLPGSLTSAFAQGKPESLAMMTWGGLWGNGVADNIDAPFAAKTGVKIVQDRGSSPVERITKLKISLDKQIYDLVQLHDGVVPLAESQGVLEPLDENSPNLPFLKNIPARFRTKGWVAQIYSALGIAYNKETIKTPPRSFADLWKPEFKGRIILPEITHSIGPYIIPIGAMAAGKPASDAEAGFDMLRKMNDLDPIWAKDTDTIMGSLASGEADIGLLYKSQTYTVISKGGKVEWVFPAEGAISYLSGTGIAKNTPNKALAEQYINMTLDPQYQLWVAKVFNYAGSNPAMIGMLPPDLQARVQFTKEEIARIVDLDQDSLSRNRAEWTDRWNRVISGA